MSINLTTISWVLGSGIFLYTLFVAIKSWYDLKCSPYFFLRRQAEQQLQQYSLASIVTITITLFLVFYTFPMPVDTVQRIAYLEGVKPPRESTLIIEEESVHTTLIPTKLEINSKTIEFNDLKSASVIQFSEEPIKVGKIHALTELPVEYREEFTPSSLLTEETKLGAISFSDEIDASFNALNPTHIFDAGFYTLYATFSYDKMADGIEWAWTWFYNGKIVAGGTQLWSYGSEGPGFVYYQPEEGFLPGEYVLQIWVNEELMQEDSMVVTSAASR